MDGSSQIPGMHSTETELIAFLVFNNLLASLLFHIGEFGLNFLSLIDGRSFVTSVGRISRISYSDLHPRLKNLYFDND